jgi:hypothetical protein
MYCRGLSSKLVSNLRISVISKNLGMMLLGFVAGSMVLAAVQTISPLPPTPQNGGGIIEGVVNRIDNAPIRDALITLIASTADNPRTITRLTTMTDDAGKFVFRRLPHG